MQNWAIGIDLGGTKIETALVDNKGRVIDRLRTATNPSRGAQEIIDQVAESINTIIENHKDIRPSVIGIGVAGQIDKETGDLIYAPNLEWHNVPLKKDIAEKLGIPTFVFNDVKAAAYGEWKYGAGLGCNTLICMFIGTGIGGGIVNNGEMMHGCNNTAGEVGHMTIDIHGPVCHCGKTGCFEALAGGWAIARDAQTAIQADNNTGKILLELANGDIKAVNAEMVFKAAKHGDKISKGIIDNAAQALIAGTASIVNVLGPCSVILGGGIIEGAPELISRIEEGVRKEALKAAVKMLEIKPAKLHNDAGVIGAAAFALQLMDKQAKKNETDEH